MDPSPWSPFEQQFSRLSGGSPHLPPSAPHEETLNNFGSSNSNPLLMSSCQGLPMPRTNAEPATVTSGIGNSNYEELLSPPIQQSKETDFFDETLFNGVCKENQSGVHNFLQAQGSARSETFPTSESTSGYPGQVPPISFHSSNIDRPSPGPFGVLPHEAVMTRPGRYERNNNDKFISKPPSVSYTNGPYTDRDVNNVYSSAPLSAQSTYSGDTASLSPVVNSVTSPSLSNFSSPSEYYSSPKTNFGAYNSLQSPVPQSPSVAQSYPSSPFTNVDPAGHISSAPPCSPMSSGSYVNNMNTVSQRNGQKSQHSPPNSSAGNAMCYNTPQSQNMVHHGPPSVMQKTPPEYHSDFAFAQEHNSSYQSVYPPMHPGPLPGGNNSRISPRAHTPHNSIPHDGRMAYSHSNAPISSPTYLQKVNHEAPFGPCSNLPPGQPMHPPRYPPCSPLNPMRNNLHQNHSSMMSNHLGGDRQYNYSSDLDGKNALDIFNSHVDSGIHNHDATSSISNFLENDLPILESDVLSGRQPRLSDSDESRKNCTMNMENPNRNFISRPPLSKEPQQDLRPQGTFNYPYSSSQLDPVRPGNFTLNGPRRRGRRGRRRKVDINSGNISRYPAYKCDRNMYSNGYPMHHEMMDYGNYNGYNNTYDKRLCDEKELPPVNYPLSRYRSELKMTENQKKNCSVILTKQSKSCVSIEEELRFLGNLRFPDEGEKDSPHTFMKTRNKDTEGFLQCYKNFLANRRPVPDSDPDSSPDRFKSKSDNTSKEKHKSEKHGKLIIRMGRCNNLREWRLTGTSVSPVTLSDDESASDSSGDIPLSSHKVKKENDAEEKSKRLKHSGKLNKLSERYSKHSANRKSIDHSDKYSDYKETSFTNSETFPAGKIRVKAEIESSPTGDEQLPSMPKKRGRKAKHPAVPKSESKKKFRKSPVKSSESSDAAFIPITIKQEILDDEENNETSRRTLRTRRSDTTSSQETNPGSSMKKENIVVKQIDLSSDDEVDLLDDSDSDPAWTPGVKSSKGSDHIKSGLPAPTRKRSHKLNRRHSGGNGAIPRHKKEKSESGRKRHPKKESKEQPKEHSTDQPVPLDPNIKVKKEKERFLVAKADLDKKTPYLWRIDKETNMLQRFEWYEQQGIILYRSTYTYAAWSEVQFSNYVTANVKIISHSRILYVVEYLGPVLPEDEEKPSTSAAPANETPVVPPANPLRENFEVFLQTLISQALDPNFLTEITNENDEYFLNNIKEIESVTESKTQLINNKSWSEDLVKTANTYPCVNILDDETEKENCQACGQDKASKLLEFEGQPYDPITLGSLELLSPLETQYSVCSKCSVLVCLYSRLQHQKYNFFIKCCAKMTEVKTQSDKMESHVLLEECLQDHNWVNSLYEELEAMWKQCDEKS